MKKEQPSSASTPTKAAQPSFHYSSLRSISLSCPFHSEPLTILRGAREPSFTNIFHLSQLPPPSFSNFSSILNLWLACVCDFYHFVHRYKMSYICNFSCLYFMTSSQQANYNFNWSMSMLPSRGRLLRSSLEISWGESE